MLREYHLSESDSGELQAPNRANNLRIGFSKQGVRITDRNAEQDTLLMTLSYRGMARGAKALPPAEPAQALSHADNRAELEHGAGVTEWYVNSSQGLEHGFILQQRPRGELPLRILLDISSAEVALKHDHAVITSATGRRLNYGKLLVLDANQKPVPARIDRLSDTRLALVVEDRKATYPLWVDPLLNATADTQLEEDQASAFLGTSVAGAGDVNGDGYADVIVGARNYDNGETAEGAAFVYHGNGGSGGRPVISRQIIGDGGSQMVHKWGGSDSADNFQVKMVATSATGRCKVKLQIETCPSGSTFDDTPCSITTSSNWITLTPDSQASLEPVITESITGLTIDQLYHWRARLLYAPDKVTEVGITEPAKPSHGPWRYFQAAADAVDIRTGTPQQRTVGFTTASSSAGEATGVTEVTVTLSTYGLPSKEAVTVNYASADGSATAGTDYTASSGTLTFPFDTASGTTQTITVPVIGDDVDEANETFMLTLSAPTGADLGTSNHTVTITDDDGSELGCSSPPADVVLLTGFSTGYYLCVGDSSISTDPASSVVIQPGAIVDLDAPVVEFFSGFGVETGGVLSVIAQP